MHQDWVYKSKGVKLNMDNNTGKDNTPKIAVNKKRLPLLTASFKNIFLIPVILCNLSLVIINHILVNRHQFGRHFSDRELAQLRLQLEKAAPDLPALQAALRRVESVDPPEKYAVQTRFLRVLQEREYRPLGTAKNLRCSYRQRHSGRRHPRG